MSGENQPRGEPSQWWRQGVTLLGVAGILVTLIFNALGVWKGAQQDEERRESEQIGLFTELHSRAIESEDAVIETGGAGDEQCADNLGGTLAPKDEAVLRHALGYYEYLAWLFNTKRLNLDSSRQFFSFRMVDGQLLAQRYLGEEEVRDGYPQLAKFVRATPKEGRRESPCDRIK